MCQFENSLPNTLYVGKQKVFRPILVARRVSTIVRNWPEADELDDTIGRQVSRVQRTYWPRRCQGSLIGEAIIGGIYVQE
jgi:hypothetical protein